MPHLPPAGCSSNKSGYSLLLLLVPPTGKWAESCPHTTLHSYACLANGCLSHVSHCSLVYIVSAVASPFLGLMVDFVGYNVHWVNVGTILTLASHALFAFTAVTPYFLAVRKSSGCLNTSNPVSCWEEGKGRGGEGGDGCLNTSNSVSCWEEGKGRGGEGGRGRLSQHQQFSLLPYVV